METLFVQPHLGLGDAIISNGLVRVLAQRHEHVFWPAKYHNFDSVREMWADVSNVHVLPVKDDHMAGVLAKTMEPGVLRLGMHAGGQIEPRWDEQFYRQAGVEFGARWGAFKCPEVKVKHPQGFALKLWFPFFHDDPSRGFLIQNDRRRDLPEAHTIWEHLPWLQNAPEIHVIDSCFLCLADSVGTKAKRLVLHAYATVKAKPMGPPRLKKDWEILR